MIKTVIILCAGGYQRYLCGMTSVRGGGCRELSIEHKVRTIREILGINEVVLVVGWKKHLVERLFVNKPYVKFVRTEAFYLRKNGEIKLITHEHGRKFGSGYSLLQSQPYWKDETVVLGSDVIYSRKAFKEIFNYELTEKNIVFFGKEKPTDRPQREPSYDVFGTKFNEEGQRILLSLGDKIKAGKGEFEVIRSPLTLLRLSLVEKGEAELYIVKNFLREINSVGMHYRAVAELYAIPEEKEHFYPKI